MKPLNYRQIEHTADIGIRVAAPDIARLFIDAGLAVFDIIAEKTGPAQTPVKYFPIELEAANVEELLVAWLNELISLSDAEDVIVSDIGMERADEHSLKARVAAEDQSAYRIKTLVKGATYHHLTVLRPRGCISPRLAAGCDADWEAEVILDV